jgi:hypothetical protein
VAAIARADVPQSCVAAQPRGAEASRERRGLGDPRVVEVVAFLEVRVEEVVRGREAARGPVARRRVDAALEIRADLEEAQQVGPLAAERERIEAGRAELGRYADAERRQRRDARCERRARVPARRA